MGLFTDKIVFITGAGSGLGRGIAIELATRGAVIVATDRNATTVEETAATIRSAGNRAESRTLDVTNAVAVRTAVEESALSHGRLDYIFNNAGIGFAGEIRDSTLEQWHTVMDVNFYGVLHGVLAAYPIMVQQGSGHIVNTASLAGLAITPTMSAYAASKHAVVGLSRAIRAEGVALGVKVTTLCPSFIESSIYENSITAGIGDTTVRSMVPFPIIPLREGILALIAGVERNEELVVIPRVARTLWWMIRFAPKMMAGKFQSNLSYFRRKQRIAP